MKYMMRLRGADGSWTDVPAIAGRDGTSAYQAAQAGGYTGTEAALNGALAGILDKAGRCLPLSLTLPAAGWAGGAQTVTHAGLLAAGYVYIIAPAPASLGAYAAAMVYADDVTRDGQITFRAAQTPEDDLTVNILRLEAVS